MPKPILISGIQPTGRLHLGNYLGALKNFVDLQNSGRYKCFFFIADYHSLTRDFDPKKKQEQVLELTTDYFSAGLDPEKSVIFIQSAVSAHTELAWILNTVAPFGETSRMTQFKEKSEIQKQNVNVGLFTYPLLMVADIVLYDASFIPVGEDQLQHLEFTRTLIRKFNKKFGKIFIEPAPTLSKMPKVLALNNPLKKMSKSEPAGCLFLNDSPADIKKKIKSAVTDSGKELHYDPKNKKAISSLMLIYSVLGDKTLKQIEKDLAGKGYGEFKNALAELLVEKLKLFRDAKTSTADIRKILATGNKKANKIASAKLKEVKKKIGLVQD